MEEPIEEHKSSEEISSHQSDTDKKESSEEDLSIS
jgi:hypothetical protein